MCCRRFVEQTKQAMTIREQNQANRVIVKEERTVVIAKQRKNGSWYANCKNVNQPFHAIDTATKTKRQANGETFKTVTVICQWAVSASYHRVLTEWNQ